MAGIRLMPSGFGAVAPVPALGVVSAEGRVIVPGEAVLTGKDEAVLIGKSVGSAARGFRPLAGRFEQLGRW
ncbi:hypothetical protein [Streptosporangium sp. 'caverna']|uniref:hypothetical protein n=1 Tax=Streptosporangium sp. 'caverna' TaxID=2202249 RepID=UPI000D7E14E6|nr:hypothetical protein [Streptosporangium sp. 'caverna']AWS45558.1 hypothetical protein DKM19_33750 [Streptosporangium sp. 'caverna']